MLLKTSQVAALLHLSTRTISRYGVAGEFTVIKVGKQLRWPSEQFDAFVGGDAAATVLAADAKMKAAKAESAELLA